MKILHITNWYPNRDNSKEALFIKRQIDALHPFVTEQTVVHIQVKTGKFRFERYSSHDSRHIIMKIPTERWFILEWVSSIVFFLILLKFRVNKFDVINAHIAYPNLTYWHWMKRFFQPKLVITEHWSAYHTNFNLPLPPPRIQHIFRQGVPIIAVSKALLADIRKFSGQEFPASVVPNVVDTVVFRRLEGIERIQGRFFMVSQWKEPKDPFTILHAFTQFLKTYPKATLIIGGYGPLQLRMQQLVEELEIEKSIEWLGVMDSMEIAREMNRASAYLHCSNYETFSVVCAEALACGCFLIASEVGGVPELVEKGTGYLVRDHSINAWSNALELGVMPKELMGSTQYASNKVGKQYLNALQTYT